MPPCELNTLDVTVRFPGPRGRLCVYRGLCLKPARPGAPTMAVLCFPFITDELLLLLLRAGVHRKQMSVDETQNHQSFLWSFLCFFCFFFWFLNIARFFFWRFVVVRCVVKIFSVLLLIVVHLI